MNGLRRLAMPKACYCFDFCFGIASGTNMLSMASSTIYFLHSGQAVWAIVLSISLRCLCSGICCTYLDYLGLHNQNRSNPDCAAIIDIKSLQNRLLKVCYVPATSAGLNRLLCFFFAVAIKSTNEANKAGSMRH